MDDRDAVVPLKLVEHAERHAGLESKGFDPHDHRANPGSNTLVYLYFAQSFDGGATWPSATATATTGGILTGAAGFCGTQCSYNVTVAMDPKNANTIYIGGNSNSTCSGLMKSATDGVTFARDSSGLHVDSHALVIDSSSTVFTGNDGGVWKRSAGAVGTAWTNLNNAPLNTLQFEGIAEQYLREGAGATCVDGTPDAKQVRAAMREPGALTTSLGWYRASAHTPTLLEGTPTLPHGSCPGHALWCRN